MIAGNLSLKHWDGSVERWIQRVNFVAQHCPETEISAIDAEARELLMGQICAGASSYRAIKDRAVMPVLKEWVAPEQFYYLDHYAPEEMELPRRKRPVRLRYERMDVFLSPRNCSFYDVSGALAGWELGSALGGGIVAPNGRPVHITDDTGFGPVLMLACARN